MFNVADDGVCIKSTPGMQSTSNIIVQRSRVRSRSSAIKFGSTTPVDIHDLLFDDIVIWDSNAGLSIQVEQPCTISIKTAFLFTLLLQQQLANIALSFEPTCWRLGSLELQARDEGTVSNVTFRNVR